MMKTGNKVEGVKEFKSTSTSYDAKPYKSNAGVGTRTFK